MKSRLIRSLLSGATELSAELLDIPTQVTAWRAKGRRDCAVLGPPCERSRTDPDCARCVARGSELGRNGHKANRLIWRVRRVSLSRLACSASLSCMAYLAHPCY